MKVDSTAGLIVRGLSLCLALGGAQQGWAVEITQTVRAQSQSFMAGFETGMAQKVKSHEVPAAAAACMVQALDERAPAYIEAFARSYFTEDEPEVLENFYSSTSGQKMIEADYIAQRKR